MKKHPVFWFYILAFIFSWIGWFPMVAGSRGVSSFNPPVFQTLLILPAIGPALAAAIVTGISEEKKSIKLLFKPLLHWRVGAFWLMIAVVAPALLLIAGKIVTGALGLTTTLETQSDNVVPVAISAFIIALLSNPWEEVGWRGFALPRLQKRHDALIATLIVGILWGL